MKILSVDPGTRNLGIVLLQYVGPWEGGGIIPKHHAACHPRNYRILWIGVFDLGAKSDSHEAMAENLRVIFKYNEYLKAFMADDEIRDVVIEVQEGENNHNLLRGLMRPNWISGIVTGYSQLNGKTVHIVGKTQKWGWSTFRAFEKNDNGTKEKRKSAIAIFVRYMVEKGYTTSQVKEVCHNVNNETLNHAADAVVQGMYYVRGVVLSKAFPERQRCNVDNRLNKEEIDFINSNLRRRKW